MLSDKVKFVMPANAAIQIGFVAKFKGPGFRLPPE